MTRELADQQGGLYMIIPGVQVNLRERRREDLGDHRRWLSPGQAWRKWDGPWEISSPLDGKRLEAWQAELDRSSAEPHRKLEIETTDGHHIGWVNSYWVHEKGRWMDAGIVIAEEDLWGKGMGREAFALWVDYLVTTYDLPRIGMGTWSGNERMIRVAARVGMHEEARFANAREVAGKRYDAVRWGITRAEWERHRAPRKEGLRNYTPDDWKATVELTRQLYQHQRSLQEGPPFTEADARASVYEVLARRKSLIWLWQEGGQVAALARARYDEVCFLEEFVVDEGRRGLGIGARFLTAIEDHLRERGERDLFLTMVWPGNLRAIDFYRRQGFDLINMLELRKGLTRDRRGRKTVFLERQFHLLDNVP